MHAAPASTDHTRESAPKADPRRGRLLGLVRKLIAYGHELASTLRTSNMPTPPPSVAYRFASLNLALIIARITRGLMLAAALEQRLLRPPPRTAGQRATELVERTAPPTPRAPRTPRQPKADEREELLGALPTAREIAARVRNRKPGAVIAEICRDLGITGQHPLWRDVLEAITVFGGDRIKILRVIWQRAAEAVQLGLQTEDDPRFDQVMAALTHPS